MKSILEAIRHFSHQIILDWNEFYKAATEIVRAVRREPTTEKKLFHVVYLVLLKFPQWLFTGIVGATAITLLGVWAGTLGSVYSVEIGASWPLGEQLIDWNGRVGQFYKFLGLFTVLYIVRRGLVEASLQRREAKLVTVLQTMPPAGTLFRFEQIYKVTAKAVANGIDEIDTLAEEEQKQDYLEQLIRTVLHAILNLAHAFDGQPRCRYAANVMMFRDTHGLDAARAAELRDKTRFISAETDISLLKGVLELCTALSTTTDESEYPGKDTELEELALPVPVELVSQSNGLYNCLPGAPLAFLTMTGQLIDDTLDLPDWIEVNCNVAPDAADRTQMYFQSNAGQRIRSIFSYTIYAPNGSPIGVLNIHSDRPRLFNVSLERSEQFQALSAPLLQLLARCLGRYNH